MEDRRKMAAGKEIWVIKAGFPNEPVKKLWSEYAFSSSLKKYLERLGYYAVVESYDEWHEGGEADVVIVLRGHKEYFPARKDRDCVYIMWNLSHPSTITDEEYNAYDLVCIGSEIYAGKIEKRLHVPVKVLPMCADTELFFPDECESTEREYDWVFVGNSRFVKRKSVVWSIAHGIPLKIWGANWEKVLPEWAEYVVAENIPNDELPKLYRNAKVTVDDHYEDMALNGFVNTRIIEALSCGLPVISDYSDALDSMFGDAVLCYRNESEFAVQTKRIFEDYDEVKKKVRKLWPVIRENYSFEARAVQLQNFSTEIREYGRVCREQVRSYLERETDYGEMQAVCERKSKAGHKVSVIIPVYNAQKYLAECIDSVLGQTFRELEIICIDDESSDSSLDILKNYAAKDERISVYSQKNAGLAETRNRGLKKAQGEYIQFLDSDDWLEADAVETLYQASRERQLDILLFNGATVYETERDKEEHPEFNSYYERKGDYPNQCGGSEMMARMRGCGEYRTSAVMQFFNRRFLEQNGLCFQRGIIHEDNDFTFRAMLLAENAGYIQQPFYKRRVHNDSIMTRDAGIKHVYGYFRAFLNMLSFIDGEELDSAGWDAASDILRGVLYNIKKHFGNLPWQEQRAFDVLGGKERMLFDLFVQPAMDGLPALGKAQREKSELNRKLQKTYGEKSELNRKLQVTYGEKYDRGLEIKRLKKELETVKKSRSYRLARLIGLPVRVFRKMLKKIRRKI